MPAKAFDIVVRPVGSKFAKALQQQLKTVVNNPIFRRLTPKVVAARAPLLSRKGNVLRQGRSQSVRQHFSVTQRTLNKVEQFERFQTNQISCPRFATSSDEAKRIGCKSLFARTLINSTNGRGIVEFNSEDEHYPRAPLYTEYIPKKAEYRFHVFGDKVIDVQEKRKKRGFTEHGENERNTRVRNMLNGYVYCRDGITIPDGAADLAVRAVAAVGYQYGAVDVIYNEKRNQCYVLEVNSRPGIINSTRESYANAIIEHYGLTRR